MGSYLLSSFLLLSTWYVKYLMAIWRIAFIVFFMSDLGLFRFLRSSMLLLYIMPFILCSNDIIDGLYLSSFVCTPWSRNLPYVKVNSII